MGQRATYCRSNPAHTLIAHRVNDPADGPRVIADGAHGVELDVRSDGSTWFVNHDSASGLTWREYLTRMAAWPQWPVLVYVDIKTPDADRLNDLYVAVATAPFKRTRFIFSTAYGTDAEAMLRLDPRAELCVDFLQQQDAHRLWHAHGRRFWLADGIAAWVPNRLAALRADPWPFPVEGRIGWTYSNLGAWDADVRALRLTATIVEQSLVKDAAEVLNCNK